MKKQTEILNYIRQKCLNGEKLTMRQVAKEFKTSNRHLATAEELGYIQKVGPKLYRWKVGEVLPVMAKLMSQKISEYYKHHNNRSVTTTLEEGPKKILFKGDQIVSVTADHDAEKQVQSVIQDCDFWERMYNDLKERHQDVLKTNKELIEISERDDKRINELRDENKALKIDLDFLKTLDDAGNTVIDGLKTDLNRLQAENKMYKSSAEANHMLIHDLRAKISQLEDKVSSKKKRWDFTLFGLPIFGTYEK